MTELAKPFKKLLENPSTRLLRLPAWVRGYGAEMLRVASRPSGRVCDSAAVEDVAFAIRAHPGEEQELAEAIRMLMEVAELVEIDGALYFAKFAEEQRNYEASRKQAYRDRERATSRTVPDVPDSPAPSVCSGTVPQEERRGEEIREEQQPPEPVVVVVGKVACPKDLRLTEDQRLTLVGAYLPDWAIDALTTRFVANHTADPEDRRQLVHWRKCLSQAISGWYNNPNTRPKKPEPEAKADDTGGYGKTSEWVQ